MWQRDDHERLRDMLDYAQRAVDLIRNLDQDAFSRDEVRMAAAERFLEIVGEAAARLPDAVRAQLPSIPWRGIIGMRNRLIHGYGDVDALVVWETIQNDLPALIRELHKHISST